MANEKWREFSISACSSILHLWFVFNGGTTNGKFINDFPIPDAIPYHYSQSWQGIPKFIWYLKTALQA